MVSRQLKWDQRYLELAAVVASWSKDPSSKVGAVIVKHNRVVSLGFNGFPPGIADTEERLHNRELKYPLIVHAEMNAILQAGHEAKGSTLYLAFPSGGVPCQACTKHLITAGVELIVSTRFQGDNERWREDQAEAWKTLSEANIGVRLI